MHRLANAGPCSFRPIQLQVHAHINERQLGAKGIEKLDIQERFKRAGLTNEYEGIHSLLSAEAHNNISELQSRYRAFRLRYQGDFRRSFS
jgi:hypothetical protein